MALSDSNTSTPTNARISHDGITWSAPVIVSEVVTCRNIIWCAELEVFVTGGNPATANDTNIFFTSPDGINWTRQSSPTQNYIRDICFSPKLRLIVAAGGNAWLRSTDGGITWVQNLYPSNNYMRGVCWSPELEIFAAVAGYTSNNRSAHSLDGINWFYGDIPNLGDNAAICWSPELGMFVAGGATNSIYSYDGINWTEGNGSLHHAERICWAAELGVFVAGASTDPGSIFISYDGLNWEQVNLRSTFISSNRVYKICWSPELGKFVAAAYELWASRSMKMILG